jgi:hypothetical protein
MPRPAPDDWRRQGQERDLLNARLCRAPYVPPSDDWDHDHCEFCWAKFMPPGPDTPSDALHEGYVTEDAQRWVCPVCAADFAEEFNFSFDQPPGPA